MCLKSSLTKSCAHQLNAISNAQVKRLLGARFPSLAVTTVAERLKKSISTGTLAVADSSNKKRVVSIPYIHSVSLRPKK